MHIRHVAIWLFKPFLSVPRYQIINRVAHEPGEYPERDGPPCGHT